MAWTNSNYSILPWYDSINQQYWRKSYVYGQVWPLVCKTQRLPPFQVIRRVEDPVLGPLTSFTITRVETQTTTEMLSNMITGGLTIEAFTEYDIIVYPGLADLTDITLPEGQYYCTMTDGTYTWVSEIFVMKDDLSKMIFMKFWHEDGFVIPGGHIHYDTPFYNFVYLGYIERPINKPKYAELEEVDERALYEFPIFRATRKDYRFSILMPEYMADILRLVPSHDYVVIISEGITYNCDRIKFNPSEWVPQGHLIPVEFEFSTDTVVHTTGRVLPENTGHEYDQTEYDDSFA